MTLRKTFAGFRAALMGIAVFSALVNILYLTGSFYMLQVYDRVIPSRSVPTLLALSALALLLYFAQALLDFVRARMLSRVARAFDDELSPRVFELLVRLRIGRTNSNLGLQPLRDLDQVRSFLASGGPLSFLDLPWLPLYLAICFLFHPWLGVAALVGAIILVVLTICTETFTRDPIRQTTIHGSTRLNMAEAVRRNAEVLAAMGMTGAVGARWEDANRKHLDGHDRTNDVAGGLGGLSKVARAVLQSGMLGIGAYLVIINEASAGVIIAGSILSARALAPVEQVIAHWKGFASARQSWSRLQSLLDAAPESTAKPLLRDPSKSLILESVHVAPPASQRVVVSNVSFTLEAGSALGIIGASASGKSSLARAMVGVWQPVRGSVRLDGATLDQWSPKDIGRHVGYLPQDIELFDGTIGENISRFAGEPDPEKLIRAAEQAGVHDMIVHLPNGYETRIGEEGLALSGGQRQRVALARALYGDPFLVVLDEPNSNLDGDGEAALRTAIEGVRARGGIAVVIAHRPSALTAVDLVLLLVNGEAKAFGPRDEVVRKAVRPVSPAAAPTDLRIEKSGAS